MQPDLWQFAVELYQREGVEQACLTAQENGYSVCLLLCAAWLDQQKIGWQQSYEQQLTALAHEFEERHIKPLRHLRNAWKPLSQNDPELESLRQQLKQLELSAEQLLLTKLQTLCLAWSGETHNTASWLAALSPDAELCAALRD